MGTIEFPKLGIKFSVNNVAFEVFNIKIYWYGILIASAFLLAIILALRDSKKYHINQDNLIDVILWLTPASIIGARLYYVAFSWDEFQGNFLDIINTRKGGLAIYGGVIGALIAVYIFCRIKKIKAFELLDFGIPYLPLAQAIGRWGNFFNQEAYGVNTDLPWGMTGNVIQRELGFNADKLGQLGILVDPTKPVHPTFLYESLWDLGVFLVLIWYRKRKKVDGEVLFLYAILYGLGRAWIEGLRTDSLMAGNIRISQILSIVLVITFSIIFIIRRRKSSVLADITPSEIGTSDYGDVLRSLQDEENESILEHDEIEQDKPDEQKLEENNLDEDK